MHLMEFPTAALTEQLGTTMTAHRIDKIKLHNKDTYKSTNKPEDLVTDHTEADNPYASLYGDNEWEDEIRRTGAVRGVETIRNLDKYMVEAAMDVYKDTEIKPMIWHDSLSLFMATKNMDWMATQHTSDGRKWRDLFILPEAGLNDGLQYYRNRLPGNSPDLMNWDNSLNKDVIDVIDRHVIATTTLDDNDDQKFSLATPKMIQEAVF